MLASMRLLMGGSRRIVGHSMSYSTRTSAKVIPTEVSGKVSAVFQVHDNTGALQRALQFFAQHKINLTMIESRPSKLSSDYDFYVDFEGNSSDTNVQGLLTDLKANCKNVLLIGSKKVPWFPRSITDMDYLKQVTLDAGDDLESDHPGFSDKEYRERRAAITKLARSYKHGDAIPKIEYSKNEINTWGAVWDKLHPLIMNHACKEYLEVLPQLETECGYSRTNIPQLEDISLFLQKTTGFRLRPVAGLLSPRDFFYGLAFRVFYSTQYIRHHSRPLYTPEPDVVHEIMGHAPMFGNQAFADFSQEIGLAAIGASEEQITELARCYWYTVEFGLCQQNGQRKAYGAGLLSSFGELEYAMSSEPQVLEWNPDDAAHRDYPITKYQPVYYLADSFDDAKVKMRAFAESMPKHFHTRFKQSSMTLMVDRNLDIMPMSE